MRCAFDRLKTSGWLVLLSAALVVGPSASGQEPQRRPLNDKSLIAPPSQGSGAKATSEQSTSDRPGNAPATGQSESSGTPALHEKFQRLLTGAKMTGMFTIDGRSMEKLTQESYEIEKVEKQDEGDLWAITARIKYGDKDLSFPVPVEVKWAGSTPVITLDKVTIPGLGTFSARVLFHGQRYAGTWQHDEVGGHMFGKVELPK